MDYLIAIACLTAIGVVIYLVYRFKKRKPAAYLKFQKRKPYYRKRKRHVLLDRERGKIIPFPAAGSKSQAGGGPGGSTSNNSRHK